VIEQVKELTRNPLNFRKIHHHPLLGINLPFENKMHYIGMTVDAPTACMISPEQAMCGLEPKGFLYLHFLSPPYLQTKVFNR
jgi:hypothetical protein